MLVFGRSPNLILGAVTAIFNVIVVFHILGFNPDATQIAVTNVAFGAIIALIANTASIQVAAGIAASNRQENNNDKAG